MALVLGLDMGGTATRAVLASTTGSRRGEGRAGPGNPFAHPPEHVAATMKEVLLAALRHEQPRRVRLGLIGMAGGARLAEPTVFSIFEQAWHAVGLRCPMRVVGDTDVAYAAGTAEPDGTVLIAGTGAVAATIAGHHAVRSVGGHGWLLGDEGAGSWLGREAVRALLAVADGRATPGRLTELVRGALLDDADPGSHLSETERIVGAVDHARPVRLAALAPLVSQAAELGDATARGIVDRAAEHLRALLMAVRASSGPVVLAGSVLTQDAPVGRRLRQELTVAGVAPVCTAVDGAAGAAWLATRMLADDPETRLDARALHCALLRSDRSAAQ